MRTRSLRLNTESTVNSSTSASARLTSHRHSLSPLTRSHTSATLHHFEAPARSIHPPSSLLLPMGRPAPTSAATSAGASAARLRSSTQTGGSHASPRTRNQPAATQPTATTVTSTHSLPPLLRLPTDVVHSIAQLLDVREKLTHFTHIHRSLPRLTPAAFRHDSLDLLVDEEPVPPHLLPLLSSVASLSYD